MLRFSQGQSINVGSTYILLWGTQMSHEFDPAAMLNDKLAELLEVASKPGFVFNDFNLITKEGEPFKKEWALRGIPCAIEVNLSIEEVKRLLRIRPTGLYKHIHRLYPLAINELNLPIVDLSFEDKQFIAKNHFVRKTPSAGLN